MLMSTPNTMKKQVISLRRAFLCSLLLLVAESVVLPSEAYSAGAPLAPGTSVSPAPSGPTPGGTAVAGGVPVAFTAPTFTGTLTSTVLSDDPTNPLGGLTFTYLLSDDVGSSGEIERVAVVSFAGVMVNVDFVPNTGDVPPAYFNRSTGSGNTVDSAFVNPPFGLGSLQPGQTSDLLVVYTNSQVFTASTALVSDGSGIKVDTYATPALPGDVNFDGVVNGLDISLVSSNWLQSGNNLPGDANFDGVINGLDIAVISSNWLQAAGSGAAAVSAPEPPTIILATLALLAYRRRYAAARPAWAP
jgi:hypothetical protein